MVGKFSVTIGRKRVPILRAFQSHGTSFRMRRLPSSAHVCAPRAASGLKTQDESSSFNEPYRRRTLARRCRADKRGSPRSAAVRGAGHPDRGIAACRARYCVCLSAHQAGRTFDDDKASESIRALYATGFFNDVKISTEGNVVIVHVQERPAVGRSTSPAFTSSTRKI